MSLPVQTVRSGGRDPRARCPPVRSSLITGPRIAGTPYRLVADATLASRIGRPSPPGAPARGREARSFRSRYSIPIPIPDPWSTGRHRASGPASGPAEGSKLEGPGSGALRLTLAPLLVNARGSWYTIEASGGPRAALAGSSRSSPPGRPGGGGGSASALSLGVSALPTPRWYREEEIAA
jgi:hypothetical protein